LNNESKVIKLNKDLKALESEVKEINDKIDEIKRELSVKKENIQSSLNRKNILEVEIKKLKEDLLMHKETSLLLDANKLAEKESEVLKKSYEINNKKTLLERKLTDLISNNDFLNNFVDTKVEIEINKAYRDYSIQELQSSFNNLLKQKNDLGPINFKAKESYNQLKDEIIEQESKIKSIQEILKESNLALKSLDYHVNSEVINSAQKINEKLGLYFNEIFNGSASLIPTKSPITNGITLEVKLPGRKFLNLGMLSGGERAMISILLYVALMENNQTPFCYFDEVDASLDEANLERFINLLHILKRSKQLIVVTHQRLTMEAADNLIGISKNQEGEINCITTKK
jgi:chromosome segregation protein